MPVCPTRRRSCEFEDVREDMFAYVHKEGYPPTYMVSVAIPGSDTCLITVVSLSLICASVMAALIAQLMTVLGGQSAQRLTPTLGQLVIRDFCLEVVGF